MRAVFRAPNAFVRDEVVAVPSYVVSFIENQRRHVQLFRAPFRDHRPAQPGTHD